MKENLKQPLLISVMFFVFSLVFVVMFITSVNYNHNSKTTYEDLIYREFTVEGVREVNDPDGDDMYYIDVAEEETNIKVNNLLANKKVKSGVLSLQKGDTIYCYLKNGSSYYEIAELKTESGTILSLDDYNRIYKHQGNTGIVISPIMFAVMLGIAVKAFVAYMKEKKRLAIS